MPCARVAASIGLAAPVAAPTTVAGSAFGAALAADDNAVGVGVVVVEDMGLVSGEPIGAPVWAGTAGTELSRLVMRALPPRRRIAGPTHEVGDCPWRQRLAGECLECSRSAVDQGQRRPLDL